MLHEEAGFSVKGGCGISVAVPASKRVMDAAAKIAGVAKVLLADAPQLAAGLAENVEATVLNIAKDYSHIVAPATAYGKNIAPRVAAKLDVAQISEITAVVSPDTFERPIYAGNAIATVQSGDAIKVITVRATSFDAVAAEGGSAAVEKIEAAADRGISQFVNREVTKLDRPELTSANIIVSGGRWRTSSARRWAPRAPRWTPVTCRTTTRSVKRAKSSRRNCTWQSGSRVRFSTWRA